MNNYKLGLLVPLRCIKQASEDYNAGSGLRQKNSANEVFGAGDKTALVENFQQAL
jgi:hypothetical protein